MDTRGRVSNQGYARNLVPLKCVPRLLVHSLRCFGSLQSSSSHDPLYHFHLVMPIYFLVENGYMPIAMLKIVGLLIVVALIDIPDLPIMRLEK